MNTLLPEQFSVRTNLYIRQFLVEAKKLHDNKLIYAFYGALDGVSNSFSMLKYYFDLYYSNTGLSSSDMLHNWLLTPWGMAVLAIDSSILAACSWAGNYLEEDGYSLHLTPVAEACQKGHVNCFVWHDDQLAYIHAGGQVRVFNQDTDFVRHDEFSKMASDALKKGVITLSLSVNRMDCLLSVKSGTFQLPPPVSSFTGPVVSWFGYGRDVLKAMKNPYKGLRNSLILADFLTVTQGLRYVGLTAGLGLGVVAALNRTWLRKIRDARKDAKKVNQELINYLGNQIVSMPDHAHEQDWEALQKRVRQEHDIFSSRIYPASSSSQYFWLLARLSGAFSGLVDSPYLYFGALGLTFLSPASWMFLLIARTSCFYAMVCIATRIYEEQNYQRDLLVTQLEAELGMFLREYSVSRHHLLDINASLQNKYLLPENRCELEKRRDELDSELKDILIKADKAHEALLEQLTFSTFSVLMGGLKNGLDAYGATASLMFAIAGLTSMLLWSYWPSLIIAFVVSGLAGMLIFTAIDLARSWSHIPEKPLSEMPNAHKTMLGLYATLKQEIDKKPVMMADPWQQRFLQDWWEVFRLMCSGGGKGLRFVDMIFSSCQQLGNDGHFHTSPGTVPLALIGMSIFSATFSLRGVARLGRNEHDNLKKQLEAESSDKGQTIRLLADYPMPAQSQDEAAVDSTEEIDLTELVESGDCRNSPQAVTYHFSQDGLNQYGVFAPSKSKSDKDNEQANKRAPSTDSELGLSISLTFTPEELRSFGIAGD